jgi:hypothetical protein
MRNLIVFILVALFACGGLMLVGCKKKEEPVETAETGEVMPETVVEPVPETPATPETPAPGEEPPVEEGAPGEGGM